MWVVLSVPLGMAFGTTAWAVLRGRGSVAGLILFVLLSAVGAGVGALAAEAVGGSQAALVSGLGATAGALVASLGLALAVGPGLGTVGDPTPSPALMRAVHGPGAETFIRRSELLPGALDTTPVAVSSGIRSSTPGR